MLYAMRLGLVYCGLRTSKFAAVKAMAFFKRGITRKIQCVCGALNINGRPISMRCDGGAVKFNTEGSVIPLLFSIERTLNEVDMPRGSEWWRKIEAYRGEIYVVDG